MLQGLTKSETIDGMKLREVAEKKNDESILIYIRDKDCVVRVSARKSLMTEYAKIVRSFSCRSWYISFGAI